MLSREDEDAFVPQKADEYDTFSLASVGRPNVEILIMKDQGRPPKNLTRVHVRAVARLGTQRKWEPTAVVGLMTKSNETVTNR